MSEVILIFILFFVLLVVFLFLILKQSQRNVQIWQQEVSNLRLEFKQELQGTIQSVNSQVQGVTSQVNAVALQLSNHVNQMINQMLTAVGDALKSMTEQVGQSTGLVSQRLDNAAKIIAELQKQVGQLQQETSQIKSVGQSISKLEDLFKGQQFRGKFGEFSLKKLIEDVLPSDFYEFQYSFRNGQKVDAVIKFQDRILPIDSKFPLDNYVKMREAKDDVERDKVRKEFFKDVKNRVNEIAKKYILPDENTFDFAMMYIPSDGVYYDLISGDDGSEILEYMHSQKVIPVSPSIFYAQLRVFTLGFRAMQVEKNAKRIVDSLSRLGTELLKLMDEFQTLGRHINSAQSKYIEVSGKLMQFKSSVEQITGYGMTAD
jgi:DNA recombination protein RmuC